MSKEEHTNSYSHILKYIGLFGGVQAMSIGVALVRNKLVALILGPGGMGLVSLFTSTVSLISDLSNFGIGLSAVQKISQAYDRGDFAEVEKQVFAFSDSGSGQVYWLAKSFITLADVYYKQGNVASWV